MSTWMFIGGRRRLMEIFPKSLQNFWNKWELQGLVIVSLMSQILLSILGCRRKYKVDVLTRSLVWSSYLVADWVATFALGVITSKLGDYYDLNKGVGNDINPQLIAFWAPFFLIHSGGPWTITAYSLEDNELWPRHLFSLVSQTLLTLYVILLSWKSTSWLSHLSLPMLVAGFLRYGEKVWCLYNASIKHHRDLLLSSMDSRDEYLDKYNTEDPWDLFRGFMGLFVSLFADVVLSTEDFLKEIDYFKGVDFEKAFRVMERELGFAFDVFYTRASFVNTLWGYNLHGISSFIPIIVGGLYIKFARNEHHLGLDGNLTYLLLSVTFMMEMHEILLANSGWATRVEGRLAHKGPLGRRLSVVFKNLRERRPSVVFKNFLERRLSVVFKNSERLSPESSELLAELLGFKRSDSLPQCNLLTLCLENNVITPCAITTDFKEFIFTSFRTKSVANKGEPDNCFANSESLEWTKRLEFHQSILTWHLATELCYNWGANQGLSVSKVSKNLSDYMFYLLVKRRHMLPVGTGYARYRDTDQNIKQLFQQKSQKSVANARGACRMLLEAEILPPEVTEVKTKSVLFDACKLAKYLLKIEREGGQMWKSLDKMWIEIVGYAAIHCRVDNHAQQLRRGGEFLTYIWLLQAHLGLLPQLHLTEEELKRTNTQPLENAAECCD